MSTRYLIFLIVLTVLALIVGVPSGLLAIQKAKDAKILAANPVELGCHLIGGPTMNGNDKVAFSVRNKTDRKIQEVNIDAYTDAVGAQNRFTFKDLAPHASEARVETIDTGYVAGSTKINPVNCFDVTVLFADGARWTMPSNGPYLP